MFRHFAKIKKNLFAVLQTIIRDSSAWNNCSAPLSYTYFHSPHCLNQNTKIQETKWKNHRNKTLKCPKYTNIGSCIFYPFCGNQNLSRKAQGHFGSMGPNPRCFGVPRTRKTTTFGSNLKVMMMMMTLMMMMMRLMMMMTLMMMTMMMMLLRLSRIRRGRSFAHIRPLHQQSN